MCVCVSVANSFVSSFCCCCRLNGNKKHLSTHHFIERALFESDISTAAPTATATAKVGGVLGGHTQCVCVGECAVLY